MLDLEDHEGQNPEEDRSPRHLHKIAQERAARNGPARLILKARVAYQRRAPARPPKPPVNRLISQISATTMATMKSQWTTKPTLKRMIARIANAISRSISTLPF